MPEIITNHDAHYAFEIVKAICREVGPGLPGTSQERERAAIIKVDPFFKNKGSVNVVGTLRKPGTQNVKRLLNFETIAHPEIAILTSEANGTVKNSPELVKSVIAAAQRAGVPYKVQSATLGTGSDAGPFSRAGLKATTLPGFKVQQMVAFYHQKWDGPEILTIEPLLNVLKLTFEWVRCGGEQAKQPSNTRMEDTNL